MIAKSAWSSRVVEIPYTMIAGIMESPGKSPVLTIVHRYGQTKIDASRLPTAADYEAVRQLLAGQLAVAEENKEASPVDFRFETPCLTTRGHRY